MSSLSSLQIKIRDIETAVDGILKSLNSVRDDMAELGGLSEAAAAVDFRKISAEARRVKFGAHPVVTASREEAEAYIDILLDILKLDDSAAEEKLIFIGSILSRSGYDYISLEERAVNVYATDRDEYLELYDKIPSGLHTVLLTDALITAHIGGGANNECARYLASLFDIYENKNIDIETYISFAKAVLTRRNNMTVEDAANAEKLGNVRCYLSDEWQGYTKGIVVLARIDKGQDVKWLVRKGEDVFKGDSIADIDGQTIKTPMDGVFWRFIKNGIRFGAVAPEKFDEEQVKEISLGVKNLRAADIANKIILATSSLTEQSLPAIKELLSLPAIKEFLSSSVTKGHISRSGRKGYMFSPAVKELLSSSDTKGNIFELFNKK